MAIEYFQKGMEDFNEGQLDTAKGHLLRALDYDADFALAYCYLSLISSDLGDPESAINYAEKGLKLEPEYGCLHFSLAVALERKGLFREAIKQYLKYNEKNPGDPECVFSIGCLYHQLLEFDEAIRYYNEAIEWNPRHSKAYYNLAFVLGENKMGSLETAISYLEKAVECNVDFWQAWVKLGIFSSRLGYIEKSIQAYLKALTLRPDLSDLHYNLGISYRSIGKRELATASFHNAIKANSEDADAWFNLGVTLMETKDFTESIEALQKAIAIDLNHEEAHYRLGCVYIIQQQWERAAKERDFLKILQSAFHRSLEQLLLASIN